MEKLGENTLFRLELIGGEYNGAIRYYTTPGIAKREAKRYRKRQLVKYGERTYWDIWEVDTKTWKKKLIETENDNTIHTSSLR